MSSLTQHLHTTSDQHEELGSSRVKRDFDDLQKIISWFEERNPFVGIGSDLQSLSSGVTADEIVNCDDAEAVGNKIHEALDDKPFVKSLIKRTHQVKTLGSLSHIIKVNKQDVSMDPSRLFSRLVVLLERNSDLKPFFEYELTPVPTSLFTENFMRKANKALLIQYLFGKDIHFIDSVASTDCCVIDGGWMLRKITWTEGCSFEVVVERY